MHNPTPRVYKYEQRGALLTVGIDENGRIFSYMERNGVVLQKDMYVKIPSEVTLEKQGWKRYYE